MIVLAIAATLGALAFSLLFVMARGQGMPENHLYTASVGGCWLLAVVFWLAWWVG